MKKWVSTLALGTIASAANAQSSVTLYGTVDDGLQYVSRSGAHDLFNTQNGALGSSKWGLTGAEDIGSGTKIIFKLEAGFDPNSGKATASGYEFNRQAYVGAEGAFGTAKLGRQYDLSYLEGVGRLAAPVRVAGGLGTHAGDIDDLFGTINFFNAASYITPDLGGFRVGGLYSLGGVAGAFSARQAFNIIGTFTRGPVSFAAGITRINNPATSVWGGAADPVANTAFANPLTNPISSGYASAHSVQIIDAAGSYKFGPMSFGLVATQVNYQNVVRTTTTPFSGTAIFRTGEVNANYFVTPSLNLGIAASFTRSDTAHYTQLDWGPKYLLSKRTLFYAVGAWQRASGTNSIGKRAVADISSLTASNTPNQVAVRVGIRHDF
ncbi:hypothetical protein ASG35_12425 [Burkholderia sp. Leaf177]|uniref:porin n=1 Tax=Burkholderia sp. Leaf177 TaxID=1736287 RepID=UPI0006FF6A9E|nr:porin [Burkholderia sp. Leaf177]KQR77067.1 hypothetical protein ASG35_12425 [Burkholderia sp. Leaf177]